MGSFWWYALPPVSSHVGLGWWNELPRGLFPNRIVVGLAALASVVYLGWEVSRRLERRPMVPIRPIPSQRWETHKLEDNPDYFAQRAEYNASKKPLWRRLFPTKEDEAH